MAEDMTSICCSAGEYSSIKTLQNDLLYLRQTWGAVISYDTKTSRYILDEPGTFLINLKITRKEAEALSCGLNIKPEESGYSEEEKRNGIF